MVIVRYYMDAECHWSVVVQPSQTIRLTLLDFELDVRRSGLCHDYVAVTYRRRLAGRKLDVIEAFRECGSLGKQVLDIPASSALIVFRTGRSSLTRRGFIIFFEGPFNFQHRTLHNSSDLLFSKNMTLCLNFAQNLSV